MNIIPLRSRSRVVDVPLIAFIDFQTDYLADETLGQLNNVDVPLRNSARLLAFARARQLPIAHFRTLRRGGGPRQRSAAASWIAGFEPRGNEHIFDRLRPSCFSNETFARMITGIYAPQLVFAGFPAHDGCLATAVDIHNRGYNGSFVKDCSSSKRFGPLKAPESVHLIYEIIERYANVTFLDAVVAAHEGRSHRESS